MFTLSFNTKMACKIIGVSLRQIQHWDETELVKPSIREAAGKGHSQTLFLYRLNTIESGKNSKGSPY